MPSGSLCPFLDERSQPIHISRCLHGAGAWPLLKRGHFDKVARAFRKPCTSIEGGHRPPLAGQPHICNAAVRVQLAVLPLEWELVFARLAFAPKVSAAPSYVLDMVVSEGGAAWRSALTWPLKALRLLSPTKLGVLPPPSLRPEVWEQFYP